VGRDISPNGLPAFKETLSAKVRQQLAPRIEHAYVTYDVAQKVEGFIQPIVDAYNSGKASNAEVVLGNMPMPQERVVTTGKGTTNDPFVTTRIPAAVTSRWADGTSRTQKQEDDYVKGLGESTGGKSSAGVKLPANENASFVKPYDEKRILGIFNQVNTASQYDAVFADAAKRNGIPADILKMFAAMESELNPNAVGPKQTNGMQAFGIMQLEKSTAAALGVDPMNPEASINAAAKMISELYKKYGNWDGVAKEYYAGPNQKNWGANTKQYVENHRAVRESIGVESLGSESVVAAAPSIYSQTGQRRTLAAQSEALAETVEKFIIDNKIPPDKAELYRSKAMSRLSGLVSIESAQQNQAAGNLLTRILEKNYTTIDQVKADPEAVQWFKQIDPTQQWHMDSILKGNRNRGNEDTNFTSSPGYHDLFKDVMDGKVTNMMQLTSRLGYGQVGLQYFPFFNKLIEDRKTGHDIIYKELDQQTRTISSQWKANPLWATPAMIEKMGFQLERWQQGVQTKITEANALPKPQRDKAIQDMFDVNNRSAYVGYGSQFERSYRPDAETIVQTALKYQESGDALPPGKSDVSFDRERKRAYLGANIQMLDRGKETEQFNALPIGTNFVIFNNLSRKWVAKTKVE
jgi:hypothetical protein